MATPRPDILYGATYCVKTGGCGELFITVNESNGKPFEVFLKFGKAGGCGAASAEAIGRSTSLHLRSGTPLDEIIKHLQGIQCHLPLGDVLSCYDGLANVLSKSNKVDNPSDKVDNNPDKADKMLTLLANNGEIAGDRGKW